MNSILKMLYQLEMYPSSSSAAELVSTDIIFSKKKSLNLQIQYQHSLLLNQVKLNKKIVVKHSQIKKILIHKKNSRMKIKLPKSRFPLKIKHPMATRIKNGKNCLKIKVNSLQNQILRI